MEVIVIVSRFKTNDQSTQTNRHVGVKVLLVTFLPFFSCFHFFIIKHIRGEVANLHLLQIGIVVIVHGD